MSSMEVENKNDLYNSVIVGQTESFDDICGDKFGLHLSINSRGIGKTHIVKKSALPWHKIKDETSNFAYFNAINITFENFNSPQLCNSQSFKSYAIRNHEYGSDGGPLYYFEGITFVNVTEESVAYLEDPNPAWANADDCGDFPCTFPNNVFLKFTDVTGLDYTDFHMIHY